jgi:hypothetical protein
MLRKILTQTLSNVLSIALTAPLNALSNVIFFIPDRIRARKRRQMADIAADEATEWFHRLRRYGDNGEAPPREVIDSFKSWFKASPLHMEQWLIASALHEGISKLLQRQEVASTSTRD